MFAKVCVLLLTIGLGYVAASQKLHPEVNLMQFMMKSRDVSQNNPTRSLSCFDYYVPLLKQIVDDYEAGYAQCLDDAAASRLEIDDSKTDERGWINDSANDACSALDACSKTVNSLEYFDCYSNAGSDSAKVMYAISANSSELWAEVREEYRLVEVVEYACTNKTEREYVEKTAEAYESLSNCVNGLEPVPDPSSSTTSTLAPSSEPSEPTGEDSSSSSTEAPETSTEASPEPSPESSPEPSPESSPEPSPESSPEPSPESSTEASSTEGGESSETTEDDSTSESPEPEAGEKMPEEDIDKVKSQFDSWLNNLKYGAKQH